MVSVHNQKKIAAMGLLLMMATSPLAVNFAQAEEIEADSEISSKSAKEIRKEQVKAILTEKIIDGELKVRHFEVPEDATPTEISKILHFRGETDGWAFVQGKAYNAGIVLFDGQAIKINDRRWEIKTQGILEIGGRDLELELSGRANSSNVILHGSATNNDLEYRVILTGKVAQLGEGNVFALAFTHAGLRDSQGDNAINLFQIGQIVIDEIGEISVDSFSESVLVLQA